MPILVILDYAIVNWDTKNTKKKTVIFGLKSYWIAYNSKTTWPAKLKSGHNVGAYECFVQTEFRGARLRDQNFTGQKWAILKRYISVITSIDEKWFVIFEHTINHLYLGYVCLSQLEYFFLLFSYFFFFFLILLRLSTFKLLNALYSKFKRLKISGRTSTRLKLGVPGWGVPPQTGPPKFWTFKPLKVDESNFWNG